ncbi:neuropeptide CCHamide-1 receptor-like [Diadema setosum]|uniref:neuropeptide CCHamide-1 receptor-like n=1 Tax=Diadema setosum TaxID=31175 RepID=UPI003B3B4D24
MEENNENESAYVTSSPLDEDEFVIPWAPISTLIIVLIFGVLANGSIIYILAKNRRLRSTPNKMVLNLAIGDLICLTVNLPFMLDYHKRDMKEWLFGTSWCKLTHCMMSSSGCITVFSLMALAIERYLAIARPWATRENGLCARCPVSGTCLSVIAIWIASFVVGAPLLGLAEVKIFGNQKPVCMAMNYGTTSSNIYKLFRVSCAFILPLVIIVIAHALTAYSLVKSIREPMTSTTENACRGHQQSHRVRSRLKLAVVIIVLSIMFAVAWLPFYVFDLWFDFFFESFMKNSAALLPLFRWKDFPVYFLSCLNPVALYVLSTKFREHLFKDCFCWHRERWKGMEGFTAQQRTSLLSVGTTFRGRSTVLRKSSPTRHDRISACSNDSTKL